MRKGLPWLTLGLLGLLAGAPSCGKDEATGDDDAKTVEECSLCTASRECGKPQVCIQLSGAPQGDGVCADPGSNSCCDPDDQSRCRTNLTGITVEESGSGGSGQGGSGGSGGSLLGGSSGSGGSSAGKGGTSSGGTGGTGVPNTTALGAECEEDADCGDDRFICLTNDAIGGGGPPGGLCTLPCTSDGQCLEITDEAFCIGFTEDAAYCLESCETGSAGLPKCHSRTDFACGVAYVAPGSDTCTSSDDCSGDELCGSDGTCGPPVMGCLPTCGGDFDCGDNVCDFGSGFCIEEKPDDLLPIGSLCEVPGTNDPNPCDGFCVPLPDSDTQGECMAFCVGNEDFIGCGFDGSGAGEAGCLFGTRFTPQGDSLLGDLMICGKLCDCNDQCPLPGDYCVDETQDQLVMTTWGRNGYCRQLDTAGGETEEDTFQECPGSGGSGGAGGSGGGGSGGSAGAGEAGEGGEPSVPQGGQGGA
jgi:hypothetical protein